MLKQKGFSPIQILLVLVVIGLIGGTGWYVWESRNKTSQTLADTSKAAGEAQKAEKKKETAKPATDPVADWVTYKSTVGVFTLKHPKTWVGAKSPELCSENLVLFGANAASVGTCASENGGQISVSSTEGNHDDEFALSPSQHSGIKSTVLAVDGIQGSRSEGTAKDQMSGEGPGGLPDGTKVVQYIFVANNNRTYLARYVQGSDYPDALADFDTMVTKTLKFSL